MKATMVRPKQTGRARRTRGTSSTTDKARSWPWLSYMCNIRSKAAYDDFAGETEADRARAAGVTLNAGHAPPLGWSYAPGTSPPVGP